MFKYIFKKYSSKYSSRDSDQKKVKFKIFYTEYWQIISLLYIPLLTTSTIFSHSIVRPWINWLSAPEQDSYLAPVEENEAFGLVGHVTAKPPAHNTMPCGLVHDIKLSFDDLCYLVEHLLFLESVVAAIHSVLLHAFGHISILNNGVVDLGLTRFR